FHVTGVQTCALSDLTSSPGRAPATSTTSPPSTRATATPPWTMRSTRTVGCSGIRAVYAVRSSAHEACCYTAAMKRSLQEYVELVVFGLVALLVGTGLLWLVGWVLSLGGIALKWGAGLR